MNLGAAINRAMQASDFRIQQPLADALGIDQGTLSRYINGRLPVTVEIVARIEDLCGLPRGQILTWGGYVDPDQVRRDHDGLQADNVHQLPARAAAGDPPISIAATGVDLDQLRDVDPATYDQIQEIGRDALARAKRRRKR